MLDILEEVLAHTQIYMIENNKLNIMNSGFRYCVACYILADLKDCMYSLVIWPLTMKMWAKMVVALHLFHISEDAELLWRLARASRDVAQLSGTSEEEKKVLVYEALEYAKRALEKNESSFAAHKVRCLQ